MTSLDIAETTLPPTPPDTSGGESVKSESPSFPLPPQSSIPHAILDVDKKTPDNHVPRDPRLIRLTGVHPFNVEAPLSDLFNEGFLTTPELFYVRNHGAVPEVKDDDILDWEFTVEGLVQNTLKLTVRDLISDFENVTYPITLVCAGNRRKEQNVVRKTKGFSWGPAGVSTALFTGVVMSEVIRRAKPLRSAKYVCMEGADKLPNGHYGTSLKLNWAMDPNKGIMLAHGMNGETLRPDHGKPLRAVVPGHIGGRSVKWLKKLILTAAPSDNWYHIYDNRVLPTMISPEMAANDPSQWQDERYAIYDLSPNSAIAAPAHGERISTSDTDSYNLRGYAYSGGGRRVGRVELSLDQGKSWKLADIDYPEDLYREAEPQQLYGGLLDLAWREHCFCWCFWSLRIPITDLTSCEGVVVRAMDDSMNVQPRDMYWSVLGMMNNPWYRIAVIREEDSVRIEHPVQPALISGGWMQRVKDAGGDLTNGFWGEKLPNDNHDITAKAEEIEVQMTKEGLDAKITIDELKQHESEEHPWFVVNGEVYDGTEFLQEHPGGAQSILSAAALDTTDEFMAIHSETAKAMMPKYHIGSLDDAAKRALLDTPDQTQPNDTTRPTFLDPRAWSPATLYSKTTISWDTRVFTFKLSHDAQTLGLPIGQHIMIRLRDPNTNEAILRSYTPISPTDKAGFIDVLVKVYFDSKARAGGRMTQALDLLPLGRSVDFKGPTGKFQYLGRGRYSINGTERSVTKFVMMCGGSGITPIYQVLRAVMQDRDDPTRCVVLDGNRLVEDILCKAELDAFAAENPDRCQLVYTLTQAPENWAGLRGRIGEPLLREYAELSEQSLALICGPEALEKCVHETLLSMGWGDKDLVFF